MPRCTLYAGKASMSEHYTGRNGVSEQVRFYRREPEYIRHLPWDFEGKKLRARHVLADTAVYVVFISLLLWVFYSVYV